MANQSHAQWTIFANALINSGKHFDVNTCRITDEMSAINLCQKSKLRNCINKWLKKLNQPRQRSSQLADFYRKEGIIHSIGDCTDNDLAADYNTKAIYSAPKDSAELALAHLNRAKCLVKTEGFIEEGYYDCQMALRLNFPEEKLRTLFDTKFHFAYLARNEDQIRDTKLEMSERGIRLNVKSRSFLENTIYIRDYNLANGIDQPNNVPKATFENNKLIEDRHSSVGRLKTTEPIKKDEQIYSEKAYSFVPANLIPDTDEISYTCQHCAKINCIPFPCYDCARASYCSPMCVADHAPIHNYECAGHQKNLWTKLGFGYLAFRTFIVGFAELVEILSEMNRPTTVENVWSVLTLDWVRKYAYGRVVQMPSPIDQTDVRVALRFALTAQLLTAYLADCTDFFKRMPPVCDKILPNRADWKIVIASLLLKHMVQSNNSGFAVSQLQMLPPSQYGKPYGYGSLYIHPDDLHRSLSHAYVFSAFYPQLSVANHSCDPNVRYISKGLDLFAYATRDIGEGDEVFVSYGPRYQLAPTHERQKQLKTEFFRNCQCERCVTPDGDKEWLKYYEYYCTNAKCNAFVELDMVPNKRWWYDLELLNSDDTTDKFCCTACLALLPVNPTAIRRFEGIAVGYIQENGISFHSNDKYVVTKSLLDLYFQMTKCLGKYHELKTRLAYTVLGWCSLDVDVKLFPRLAYITMDSFVNREERYGVTSLEFAMLAPHALNILQIASRIARTNTLPPMARDIAKIRHYLDVDKIEKSTQVLPDSLRMVFQNIIRNVRADTARSLVEAPLDATGGLNRATATGSNAEKSVG